MAATGFTIRRPDEAPTVPCPCGSSNRILTAADGLGCSFHITQINDSITHYHIKTTEVYYILEGLGFMELNGQRVEIYPNLVISIEPKTRHRLVSEKGVKTIVFGVPAFDPDDEFFD